MKKVSKLFGTLLTGAIALLAAGCVSTDASLWSYTEGESRVTYDKGIDWQSNENDEKIVVMKSAGIEDGEGSIIVGIHNKGKEDYHFVDEDITVYGGNADTGRWHPIGSWSATDYYRRAESAAHSQNFLVSLAGGLTILDSLIGTDFSVTTDSSGNQYVETTRYFDLGDAIFTSIFVGSAMDSVYEINRDSLDWLRKNLLFSARVTPEYDYTGVMFFDAGSDDPDYRFVVEGDRREKPLEFIYQRSDREDILHPWRDAVTDRHVSAFNYGWPGNNMGFTYMWLRPRNVGVYTGFTFRGPFDVPDASGFMTKDGTPKLSSSFRTQNGIPEDHRIALDGEYVSDEVDMPIGITVKMFPHAWFLLGGNLQFGFGRLYRGDLSYDEGGSAVDYGKKLWFSDDSFGFAVSPQAGIDLNFNMLDFYILGGYDFMNRGFTVDTGFGFAF